MRRLVSIADGTSPAARAIVSLAWLLAVLAAAAAFWAGAAWVVQYLVRVGRL